MIGRGGAVKPSKLSAASLIVDDTRAAAGTVSAIVISFGEGAIVCNVDHS
jgi:hypothetical protein